MPCAREVREDLETLGRSLRLFYQAAPGLAAATAALALVEALLPAAGLWLLKRILDAVAAGGAVRVSLGAYVLLLCLQQSLRALSQFLQGQTRDLLAGQVTLSVMASASAQSDLTAFESPRFHDRLLLLQREVAYRPMVLLGALAQGAQAAVTGLCMLCFLARFHPALVLALVVATAPGVLAQRRLYEAAWWGLAELLPLRRRLREYARILLDPPFAKEVRLFAFAPYVLERYREQFAALMSRVRGARWRLARTAVLLGLVAGLGGGFALAYVTDQAVRGRLTLGDLSLYTLALYQAASAAAALTGATAIVHEALSFMRELFAFLNGSPPGLPMMGGENRSSMPSPPIIGGLGGRSNAFRLEGVSFRYPGSDRPALVGLDLEIPRGSVTAIVGENGAGKSTLVRLLTRLHDPTEGRILLEGADLRDYDPEALRRQIAVLFQDFARYPLALWECVGIGEIARVGDREAIRRALRRAGAESLIARLPQGEETLLSQEFDGGVELSGGEWQRVALARTFMRDAPVLILDEPTAALDPASEADLHARFRELAAGRTTLLISHRLATVRLADRILVLEEGRLIEEGDHPALLRRGGRYAELYALQADRYR
jgi:ATP-binding cassette subfamily B protein